MQCHSDAAFTVCRTVGNSSFLGGADKSCGLIREHSTAVPHSCCATAENLRWEERPVCSRDLVPRWGNAWQGTARSSDRPPFPPGANNECELFVCNCDRTAAMCFAKAPYNSANLHLDKTKYCS